MVSLTWAILTLLEYVKGLMFALTSKWQVVFLFFLCGPSREHGDEPGCVSNLVALITADGADDCQSRLCCQCNSVYCNAVSWLRNKKQAKMNHPHLLRGIKRPVCFSNDREIVSPSMTFFLAPYRHKKWSQSSKYKCQSTGRRSMQSRELVCFYTANC